MFATRLETPDDRSRIFMPLCLLSLIAVGMTLILKLEVPAHSIHPPYGLTGYEGKFTLLDSMLPLSLVYFFKQHPWCVGVCYAWVYIGIFYGILIQRNLYRMVTISACIVLLVIACAYISSKMEAEIVTIGIETKAETYPQAFQNAWHQWASNEIDSINLQEAQKKKQDYQNLVTEFEQLKSAYRTD